MKLKYKKIIMLTTMSTMGIGLLTLSISHDKPRAEELLNVGTNQETMLYATGSEDEINAFVGEDITEAPTASPTSIPTPIPTPTPLPIYEIEEDAYPEINTLFDDYYTAKKSCDTSKLKSLLSDPSKVETVEQLQSKTEYIEDYRKIKNYTKKGIESGSFIVYVYHEIKFTGVNTPAPGLAKFYLVKGKDGKLKIFSGVMEEEIKEYFDSRNEDEDVKELINLTNEKSEKAKAKDEDLFNFWKNIDKLAKADKKKAESEGDTSE